MPWRRVLYFIGLGIGLTLFLRQVWVTYIEVKRQAPVVLHPDHLLGSIFLSFLMYALQPVAWMLIMRYLGAAPRPFEMLQGYWVSFLPRYIPGSVWGYWSRSHWLQERYGLNYTISILGSALEGLSLPLTGLVISGVYLFTSTTGFLRCVIAASCMALFLFNCLFVPRLVKTIVPKFIRVDENGPSHCPGESLINWFPVPLLHIAQWVIYGSSVLLIGEAILPLVSAHLLGVIFSSSLSWVLSFVVVFIPAGIGVRELTLSVLLSLCLEIPLWQANMIAMISRFVLVLTELGCTALGLGLYMNKRRTNLD